MAKGQKTGGRQKGTPNKITAALKEAVLQAAEDAGGKGGTVGYLTAQAKENPTAFLSLLGKVLPMQIGSDEDNPLKMVHEIKRTVVRPRNPNG